MDAKRLGLRRLRSLPEAFNVQHSHLMLLEIASLRVETFRKNLLINNDVIAGISGFLAFSRLDFYSSIVLFPEQRLHGNQAYVSRESVVIKKNCSPVSLI